MFGIGYQELLLILVIVMILFGGSKLPELAKGLGKSMKEFKKAIEADPVEHSAAKPVPDAPAAAPAPRICMSCKAKLTETWSHCPHCGTAASDAAPSMRST